MMLNQSTAVEFIPLDNPQRNAFFGYSYHMLVYSYDHTVPSSFNKKHCVHSYVNIKPSTMHASRSYFIALYAVYWTISDHILFLKIKLYVILCVHMIQIKQSIQKTSGSPISCRCNMTDKILKQQHLMQVSCL